MILLLAACGPVAPDPAARDRDGDGYTRAEGDCDDGDPELSPGTPERCDGADQDCDGAVDEGAVDQLATYVDADGDGFGDAATLLTTCKLQDGRILDGTDCDDVDPAVFPGAEEACDGTDDDCDGVVDEDGVDGTPWYPDTDGDGHGQGEPVNACAVPDGYAEHDDDCDDTDAGVSPSATEVCDNQVDDDCDGTGSGCGVEGAVRNTDAEGTFSRAVGMTAMGRTVVAADVTGDDTNDLVLSAESGVYVVGGPLVGERAVAEATAVWSPEGRESVYAVAGAFDLDQDGVRDLAIGTEGLRADDGSWLEGGRVYVLPQDSPTGPLASAPSLLLEEDESVVAACSLTNVGDTEGDGRDRLLVGSQGSVLDPEVYGAVWLISEVMPGEYSLDEAGERIVSTEPGDGAGEEVRGLGDVDGDGLGDIGVGARQALVDGVAVGKAYVLLGPVGGRSSLADADSTLQAVPTTAECEYGAALAGGQDLDDDGLDDVVLGSGRCDQVYVFADGGAVTGEISATLYGYPMFGIALASAGDVDGDGHADLLVGDPWFGSSATGTAWLFAGPITPGAWYQADAWAEIHGVRSDDLFGYNVHGLGDIDVDGYDDILGTSSSAAWLFLGGEM